jgi:uncharacterized membrane-anchored protein YhcB (DUF1043 family)
VKYITNSFLGGLIGLVAGAFLGFAFDSFYTKKSQLATKQTLQVVLFGSIGAVAGAAIGFKIASEDEEKKRKEIAYQKSLVKFTCSYCEQDFYFSSLESTSQKYCNNCISNLRNTYIEKCKEVNSLLTGVEELKRQSAIHARLDKAQQILENIKHYDAINLEFVTIKPSDLLKTIEEYRSNLR